MRSLLILIALAGGLACTPREEPAKQQTPLPTRQNTIDPVNQKLESAREDAERRRKQVDDAAR